MQFQIGLSTFAEPRWLTVDLRAPLSTIIGPGVVASETLYNDLDRYLLPARNSREDKGLQPRIFSGLSMANVPATQTCMNCHLRVKSQSPLLAEVRNSWVTGTPMRWNQVHRLPDYAYFNHAIHVNRGVSCRSCHGQINEMKVVYHAEPLSMGWCLECHRNPAPHLRPRDEVYNFEWKPEFSETALEIGQRLQQELQINPPETCQGCHR